MTKDKQTLELLLILICTKIRKYVGLTINTFPPNVRTHAALVHHQVQDLLHLAETLAAGIETNSANNNLNETLTQIKFYLDCECLCSNANRLIGKVNTYDSDSDYHYLLEQRKFLDGLLGGSTLPVKALSAHQKQYLHDSHEIVHATLQPAIQLRSDSKTTFPAGCDRGPGMKMMREHAQQGGRYHNPQIWTEITTCYNESERFLNHSNLAKSEETLGSAQANEYAGDDNSTLQGLIARFKTLAPESDIARGRIEWHNVGKSSHEALLPSSSWTRSSSCRLFTVAVTAAAAAVVASCALDFGM
ncbi:MAG: hypothetical protein K0U29_06745 [Gammaproteobacteria bacterium]|nr:hypothetical protein [Gammaproteobacteria bacterium]MCH9744612.1 hypothetical protein [Gammaproteobacteria bacterium]